MLFRSRRCGEPHPGDRGRRVPPRNGHLKGLGLGATAVGIGRPYIWGLAAFGQEGVEVVLTLLRKELELVMRQAGTVSVKAISREYVAPRAV